MTDQKILTILNKNPQQGIHLLMNLYGGAVSTICQNFLYDFPESDIEEAIADTFIRFWKYREKFELNKNYSLKSYIYAIARNVSRDKRRMQKKNDIFSLEELSLELPSNFNVENELERRRCEALLHTCLENMKEPDKSVFLYRYFYGYKIADIAAILNLTIKQVENILYRGKERLRKDLQERGVSYE